MSGVEDREEFALILQVPVDTVRTRLAVGTEPPDIYGRGLSFVNEKSCSSVPARLHRGRFGFVICTR